MDCFATVSSNAKATEYKSRISTNALLSLQSALPIVKFCDVLYLIMYMSSFFEMSLFCPKYYN